MTERVPVGSDRIDQILAHLEKIRHQLIMLKSESEPREIILAARVSRSTSSIKTGTSASENSRTHGGQLKLALR